MQKKNMNRRDFLQTASRSTIALAIGSSLIEWLSGCTPQNEPQVIAPTDALTSIPSLAASPDVEFSLRAMISDVSIFSGTPTRVWQYAGEVIKGDPNVLSTIPNSYLGPIIRLKKGQTVRVHFTNELKEPSIIHWHGLHVNEEADGHPRWVIDSGETYVYDFTVMNRAGTYWYHPHPHGRTGPQVYQGMAGLLLISDEEEQSVNLPSAEFDLPLVIQDRLFDADNQLVYTSTNMMGQMMGFLGNQILVNGMPNFTLSAQTRSYRLRILNGSNARIYKLAWQDGTPLTIVGTDGGLLEKPRQQDSVTLAPAQRIELWVDFSDRKIGEEMKLVNLPFSAFGGESSYPILSVSIDKAAQTHSSLPEQLSTITKYQESQAINQGDPRSFILAMGRRMTWTLNGKLFEMTKVDSNEIVKLGNLEVWEFFNDASGGGMMGGMMGENLPHPMHIHGLQFQVLDRILQSGSQADYQTLRDSIVDEGWHDTVLVMPGERVKVLLKFEDFAGLYLYHCHNLEHEDMGMMRNYRIES